MVVEEWSEGGFTAILADGYIFRDKSLRWLPGWLQQKPTITNIEFLMNLEQTMKEHEHCLVSDQLVCDPLRMNLATYALTRPPFPFLVSIQWEYMTDPRA